MIWAATSSIVYFRISSKYASTLSSPCAAIRLPKNSARFGSIFICSSETGTATLPTTPSGRCAAMFG